MRRVIRRLVPLGYSAAQVRGMIFRDLRLELAGHSDKARAMAVAHGHVPPPSRSEFDDLVERYG